MIWVSVHCVCEDESQCYEANNVEIIILVRIITFHTLLSCTEEVSEDTDNKESSSSGCNLSIPI